MEDNFQRFMISQVGILIRDGKCLILRDHKSGLWVLPGGRADKGETGEEAFKRELLEELGFTNSKKLGVVDYDIWYTARSQRPMCAIANLIVNDEEDIRLSFEHTEFKWVKEDEIEGIEFVWPQAHRMIRKGFEYKKLLEKNEK